MSQTFKSEGIVFRQLKYSESSVIIDIYTQEKGLRSFIVSGLRSTKSKKKTSLYQHLNIIDILAYDKEDSLARIKESNMAYFYQSIPYDVVKSSIALFMLEVSRNAIRESEQNIPLYHFLYSSFKKLDDAKGSFSLLPIQFMLQLSSYIGFLPDNNWSSENQYFDQMNGGFTPVSTEKYLSSPTVSEAISRLLSATEEEVEKLQFPKSLRNQILDDLVLFYRLHLAQFSELKSLEVLRTVF